MKSEKRTFLQILITCSFIICMLVLVGCSDANTTISTLEMISNNMTKITNTLDNVKNIENSELLIEDFMDETNLESIYTADNQYGGSNAMDGYISRIGALNNSVISTIELNSVINNTKRQIYAKTSYIKALCNQNIDAKIEFNQVKLNTLKDLSAILMANTTRINLSRNEITNNFNNVKKEQNSFSSNPEYLNSRYTKLKTSLNTRLSYFNNIFSSLDQIAETLCDDCCYPYISDDYIFEDDIKDNEQAQTTGILKKNIDTYENAGTNLYGDYRNNPIYNRDNYLKNINPGYGMGYGGYGMYGMMPYGYNMGNYGMGYGMNNFGMPFNNGYIYPNINTFGTYKNVDTYRSREKLDQEQQIDNEISKQESEIENNNLIPSTYPMPRPEPIPRPYPTQKPTEDVDNEFNMDLENKPMILPNFDKDIEIDINNETQESMAKPENARNDEEQFVDNQKMPTIEQITDGDWVVYRIEF